MVHNTAIILFDAECKLCSAWVPFVIKRDSAAQFHFCSVQSPNGQALLNQHQFPTDNFETMVLLDHGTPRIKSEAFFRICKQLKKPWPMLTLLRIFPLSFRDWVYDRIALNRYKLFGRHNYCMLPTKDIKTRFIEQGKPMKPTLAEKWLKTIAIIHIIGGLSLPLLVFSPISDSYFLTLEARFPDSNPESLRFLIGVFGPTVASWGLLFYYAILKAFQTRTSKDWWLLVCAITVWVILDSAYSLWFSIFAHIFINGLMALIIFVPLIYVKPQFRN